MHAFKTSRPTKRRMQNSYSALGKPKRARRPARGLPRSTLWSRVPRQAFPERALTKLKYVSQTSLNPGLTLPAIHMFSANNIFDPDFTGVGHQPLGYDQYAALYEQYHVRQAYAKVTFMAADNDDAGSKNAVLCTLTLKNDPNEARSHVAIMEDPDSTTGCLHGDGPGTIVLTKFYSEKNMFPNDKRHNTHSDINSGPPEQTYFELVTKGNFGTDAGSINILVEITYMVEFYERKDLEAS